MSVVLVGVLSMVSAAVSGSQPNGKARSSIAAPTGPRALTPSELLAALPARHAQNAAARAHRSASRTTFAHLHAGEAVAVLKHRASEIVDRTAWHGVELPKGAHALRYQRDERLASFTSASGHRLLVSSTMPLRRKDPDSGKIAPVDLGLERNADGFETVNPFVKVHFPNDLAEGLQIGSLRLHVGDRSESPTSAIRIGDTVAWPNTLVDTDVIANAVPQGAEITATLRSANSPEDIPVALDLPEGMTVRLAAFDDDNRGGLVIVDRQQHTIGTVSAPVAWDADHVSVSSEWQRVGDRLVLHVAHLGKDVAYPVVADPLIVPSISGADLVAAGVRGYPWAWHDDTAARIDVGYGAGWTGTGFHQGIDLVNSTRHYNVGAGAYWYLSLAGRQARITQLLIGSMAHAPGKGAAGNVLGSCTFWRVMTPTGGTDFGGQVNRCDSFSDYSISAGFYLDNLGTTGNTAQVGLIPAQAGDYQYMQQYIGALSVVMEDNNTANVPTVSGGAASWTNSTPVPVTVNASDAGLGVRAVGLRADGGTLSWQPVDPDDPQCAVCPMNVTRTLSVSGVGDGSHTVDASTQDQWNTTGPFSATLPVRIDTVAPTIGTLSGSLYDDRTTSFSGVRTVHVPLSGEGSTTTMASRRSGVKRIRLMIDGTVVGDQKDFAQQDSWIPGSTDNVLRVNASSLSPGSHTVAAYVSDWAGNTRLSSSFTITTAAGPTTAVASTDTSLFGDVDGNGTSDLVTVSSTGTVKVFPSDGIGGFGSAATWATWSGATGLLLADVDNDGDDDLVGRTSSSIDVRVARSSGTAFAAPTVWLASAPAGSLLAANLNGTGGDDLVIVQSSGTIQGAISNGSAFTSLGSWTTLPAGSQPQAADVSGDGRADLVLSRAGRMEVRKSDGSTFGSVQDWGAAPSGDLQVADADGDHTADLIARGADGIVRYFPSSGTSFGAGAFTTVLPTTYTFGVADVDGNLHADAVGRSSTGVTAHVGTAPYPDPPVSNPPGTPNPSDPPAGPTIGSLFPPVLARDGFGDYTGDGVADQVVFRQSNSLWYVYPNPTGIAWGLAGDTPAPGDYDGDGKNDFAVFRPSTAMWYVLPNTTGVQWGLANDIPMPGDYDGDGKTDFATFRKSNSTWYVYPNPTGFAWGLAGDIPVPGDYNGDGKTDIAVFRPSNSTWYVYPDQVGAQWGLPGDFPAPGDYNGDGKTDFAVFRPSTSMWYVYPNPTGTSFGLLGDIPVPGDYHGEGKTTFAVFRPSTTKWYAFPNATVSSGQPWGLSTDIPVSGGLRAAPPTSWKYGGPNHRIDTDPEAAAVRSAFNAAATDTAARTLLNGLYPQELARVEASVRSTIGDGDLVWDMDESKIYNYAAGQIRYMPYAVGLALGANTGAAKRVTHHMLAPYSLGPDIGNYATSWTYGGPDRVVSTGDEAEHVLSDLPDSTDEYDDTWNTSPLWTGMTTDEQDYVMQVALSYTDNSPSGYVPRAGIDLFKFGLVKVRLNQAQADNLRFRIQQVQAGAGACALIAGIVAADAPTPVAKGVALVVTRVCGSLGLTATVIVNEIAHDLGQSSHPGIVITVGVKMTVSWHNVVPHSAPYFSIDPWN